MRGAIYLLGDSVLCPVSRSRVNALYLALRLGGPCPVPGRVEGGGQPVLSCEQCFLLFQVFLSFLRLLLGA